MIKVGDTVKFNEYLNKNYMTSRELKNSLSGRRLIRRKVEVNRGPVVTTYSEIIIKEEDDYSGIFVGWFNKKLKRSYHRSEYREPEIINVDVFNNDPDDDGFESILRRPRRNAQSLIDLINLRVRPSKNPRRIDDPRKLDKIAMVKIGRKLLGVPLTNIYKCNYGRVFRVI